jgi:glycosyltransferase involved in cell wall biosynthesis
MSPAPSRPIAVCINALFLQDHLGGIGNYTFHLADGLRKARPDWDFTLLVHAGTAPHFAGIQGVRIRTVPLRARWARLMFFHLVFPFEARRFDLLHSVGNMGMILCPVPQVVTIHDLYERVSPERFSPGKRFLMRLLIAWTGRIAAAVIAVSENTLRDIGRFYPRLSGKAKVIYSGNKFPVSGGAPAEARGDFLFVGTIEPGKNLAHILEAFSRFAAGHPGRLKVVGAKGWNQSGIPPLLDRLGIRDRVDFLGYVPDAGLRGMYATSLALIMASSYEGFGLPVIEAMACGCPVIAARNSGMLEAGGDAALFFPTGDIGALAARMAEVAGDGKLRRAAIEAGLRHAAAFTWKKTTQSTLGVYAAVLERHGPRSPSAEPGPRKSPT